MGCRCWRFPSPHSLFATAYEASTPLMMMGTPGRPGITMSKPPPAKAVHVVPIKTASAIPARMVSVPIARGNLTERATTRVKAADQTAGKPNALSIRARSIASDRDMEMLTPQGATALSLRRHRRDNRHDADCDRDDADRALQAAVSQGQPARGDRERHRNHRRQRAHPDHRADPEQGDVTECDRRTGGLRYREHQQRRRAGHAVHQSDQQAAPAKAVRMRVRGARMRKVFAGVAVRVDVHRAVAVAVLMKMHAVAPQPPQHMRAETDQHDADGGL